MEESEKREKKEEKGEQVVWSWGAGTEGQLGTKIVKDELFPQLLHQPSLSSISSLACGGAHVIALTFAGKVFSWGRGNSGQLGHGEVVSNALFPKAVIWFSVKSVFFFLRFVLLGWFSDSGCVFTCGDGTFGQLGHGDYASHCSPVKLTCFGDQRVAQVACGMRHSLVLLKDCVGNQVYGFGFGKRGQLGVSNDKVKSVSVPRTVTGFEGVEIIGIAANGDHSAAVSVDGHIYTWGRGFKGFEDAHVPHCLNFSLNFIKVALGWNHALALTGEGEVYMLGGNHLGVLSDLQNISPPAKHIPVDLREVNLKKVPGLDGMKITDIATGAEHSVITWGWGEHGQLGLGDTCDQISPVTVNLGYDPNEAESIKVFCGSGFTFAVTMP
ncbi:Ultraviolet-B receptor UVR8 Protein UV-B RESISTANCE 8 RCC1 domain-containing protein [Vigna angularis]|uniref:Ultraviolet-B receptor UVR8 Protein UV-B RESISTANCE 8 RCC1 domain-containing protein n=1 Tax=Phaseolus angularis TaxID=3914 RepID=A0A8T0JM24_PHAAN|nr:Ultraviolet-B receptor UVR8 Protein UV-B RESISTANCE 8 RCC1 domain-containing protein [Vigna angularis]